MARQMNRRLPLIALVLISASSQNALAQNIWKCPVENGGTTYGTTNLGGCKLISSAPPPPDLDPRWKEIGRSTSNDVIYVDTKTVERSGSIAKVWILFDSITTSSKSRIAINCNTKKYATYQATLYPLAGGAGSPTRTTSTPDNKIVFEDATPESVMEGIIPVLCSIKK
jgi:hypothetical protein